MANQEELVRRWLSDIAEARKREESFRKVAHRVVDIYESERDAENEFNILYSNTETLSASLYNSPPRPAVQRRFKGKDSTNGQAVLMAERLLDFLVDTDMRDYQPLDELLLNAVTQALVPGRGVTRFKYDATFVGYEEEVEGEMVQREEVDWEIVCGEEVPWDRFLHSWATKWEDVSWVSFDWPMTEQELEDNFGVEVACKCELVDLEDPYEQDGETGTSNPETSTKGAWVHEIWDKRTKQVIFISPSLKDKPLKVVHDPLQLSGFFPCPRPIRMFFRLSSLIPVPTYSFYEKQAEELNAVTRRIRNIMKAMKVRGFYLSSVEGMHKIFDEPDNTLVALENTELMEGGIDKAIWMMPLAELSTVLQQLYTQRQQIKQVIFELTGLADIMRGSTQASETLGAQQLKSQWGTLRLRRMQKEVQRYARDCLRIMLEIAVTRFSPQTVKQMTNSSLPMQAEKEQALAIIQAAQAQQQQPPPQILALLQQPSIEEVQSILQNDINRVYNVDIETNSTVELEATEDKQDMAELMNAIAQFMNGVAPMIESGFLDFNIARSILLAVVQRFRFGRGVEDSIKAMPPPQQKQNDLEERAKVVEAQVKQKELEMEMQQAQAEHAYKMREMQMKAELAKQKATYEPVECS